MALIESPGYDLELQPGQLTVLRLVEALYGTLHLAMPDAVALSAQPAILTLARTALSPTKCPYGQPPVDIVVEFDSATNMYLRCLHGSPCHCWEYGSGRRITCPP